MIAIGHLEVVHRRRTRLAASIPMAVKYNRKWIPVREPLESKRMSSILSGLRCRSGWLTVTVNVGVWLVVGCAFAAEGPEFNRDIRPLLAKSCYACHGRDDEAR